jgi:hypothetical protein
MHLFSRFYSTTEFIFTVYMRTPSAIIGLNFSASIIFLLFVFFAPAVAQPPLKPAIVMETSPYFEKPAAGLLPKGFVEKRDMCQTDSSNDFGCSRKTSFFSPTFPGISCPNNPKATMIKNAGRGFFKKILCGRIVLKWRYAQARYVLI